MDYTSNHSLGGSFSNGTDKVLINASTENTLPNRVEITTLNIVEVTLMLVIFVLSTFGNSIVVIVVCKKRRMQTFTNWLIFNLAIADLTSSFICLPLEIPILLNKGKWIYGSFICPLLYPIQTMTIYTSVFTLVAFSLLRYWAIIYPFKKQPSVMLAKLSMVIIWIAAFICVIPYIATLKYYKADGACYESWSELDSKRYTISVFGLQYALPLTIISATYIMIAWELRKQVEPDPSPIQRIKIRENKKIVKMLLLLTITFAVCLLPFHLVFLIIQFVPTTLPYQDIIISTSYLMLYANCVFNPFLYNRFNTRFRKAFKELLSNGNDLVNRVSSFRTSNSISKRNSSLSLIRGNSLLSSQRRRAAMSSSTLGRIRKISLGLLLANPLDPLNLVCDQSHVSKAKNPELITERDPLHKSIVNDGIKDNNDCQAESLVDKNNNISDIISIMNVYKSEGETEL